MTIDTQVKEEVYFGIVKKVYPNFAQIEIKEKFEDSEIIVDASFSTELFKGLYPRLGDKVKYIVRQSENGKYDNELRVIPK